MKIITQYTTVYGPRPRGKVEKAETHGGETGSGSARGTALTFDQLKERVRLAEADNRPKADLQPKMNPALAAAITAANSNTHMSSVETYSNSDIDIFHDNSKRRGLTENKEI